MTNPERDQTAERDFRAEAIALVADVCARDVLLIETLVKKGGNSIYTLAVRNTEAMLRLQARVEEGERVVTQLRDNLHSVGPQHAIKEGCSCVGCTIERQRIANIAAATSWLERADEGEGK